MFGWNDRVGLAARNATFLFLLVGACSIVVYRALDDVHVLIACLGVILVCIVGYRAEGWIFRYKKHDQAVVKLAFCSVMALILGGPWLIQHGWPQWVVVLGMILAGTTYHYWLLARIP